jgi:glutamine synthetase-like protein
LQLAQDLLDASQRAGYLAPCQNQWRPSFRKPVAPSPEAGFRRFDHPFTPTDRERIEHMTATLEPTRSEAKGGSKPSPAEVIRRAREAGVQVVDVKFCDLPGTWQHFSLPLKELSEDVFGEGLGFDGSSIRGFQAINESDMLLFPDPTSAFVDPCLQVPTLSLTCDIGDPITGER